MASIKDWKPTELVQVLVFGSFKAGKTAGAATFPRPNILDFDQGVSTLASDWWKKKFGEKEIIYESFKETKKNHLGVVTEPHAFDDACKYFDKCMKPDLRDTFDTWIIDSGSMLTEYANNKAIYLLGGVMPGVKSNTMEMAKKFGLVAPKQQDFGAERSMAEQFIQMCLDSNKHLVLVCHEQVISNDEGIVQSIGPMFTGKSRQLIPLKFSEVYRIKVQKQGLEMKRSLMTQSDGISQVGTRLGVPDGTEWTWDAINKSLQNLKEKK